MTGGMVDDLSAVSTPELSEAVTLPFVLREWQIKGGRRAPLLKHLPAYGGWIVKCV